MVRIRHVRINGLYSYGSEKNRIDFGQRTVVVGANDAGKSSIFKALEFFLKRPPKHGRAGSKPWERQGVHEMTVGLSLNDEEMRYTAEILSAVGTKDERRVSLGRDAVVEWLVPRLKRVELSVGWRYPLFDRGTDPTRRFLHLEDLGTTAYSPGYETSAWMVESTRSPVTYDPNAVPFHDVIAGMLDDGSAEGDLGGRLARGARIPDFPGIGGIYNMEETASYRRRLELVDKMSEGREGHDLYSFFALFCSVLERRFTFVSEQRKFQESNDMKRQSVRPLLDDTATMGRRRESNDMKRLSLNHDGSNLQSYLFWLQNGDRDEQAACSAIRDMFEDVMKQQNLSFVVSAAEKDKTPFPGRPDGPEGKIYPGKTIVRFVKNVGQERRLLDFMSVGAGVRETLFLLAACFGKQDGVILLDEPAANLHPTQIRRLMDKIMSAGDQGAKSGQVAVVTHSPSLASLEMLSSVNAIVRVNRREHSLVAQPSREGKKWIEKNLATFHHLKSDILFARRVVLVEGVSDKFFLEAILHRGSGRGGDTAVVDVGGKTSFGKFRKLLEMFEIPFVILADGDAGNQFGSDEVFEMRVKTVPSTKDVMGKRVCLLKNNLEDFLSGLDPDLWKRIEGEHSAKPERAYRFVGEILAGKHSANNSASLKLLSEWIVRN